MKVVFVFVVIAISIAMTSAAWSCFTDKDRCTKQGNKCCVQVGNTPIGVCKELGEEGDKCHVHPVTVPLFDHVHILRCKCNEGMKCVAEDGIVGKLIGTCQKASDEEPAEE